MTGRIDIQLIVDIPQNTELVQQLDEACIWRQARGAAIEVSGMEDVPGSIEKVLVEGRGSIFLVKWSLFVFVVAYKFSSWVQVGVAQQWYDELDDLASPKPESEMAVEDDNLNKKLIVEDKKTCIKCGVNTSPGTSEV